VSRNSFLQCTFVEQLFKIVKKIFQKFDKKNLKIGTIFRAKAELFLIRPKFDWKNIFQKLQKKMIQEGSQ
jgi:hypothetical protein